LIAALVAQVLAFVGCSVARTQTGRDDARTLFRELRANEQEYQAVLRSEAELMQRTSQWLARDHREHSQAEVQRLRREFAAVSRELSRVHGELNRLDLAEDVERDLLRPILDQLASERSDMEALGAMLRSEEPDRGAIHEKIESHRHPENLFTPAIKRIRERYGIARQRMWRGRPLTA
jgi:chromosome segregation ATPase